MIEFAYRSGVDLDARPYRAFIAIAETGSFSRAARMLHVSQPALSAQLKEFERRLGFPLFVRSSRKVSLTNEGALFLDRARRLVTETEWANNAARELASNQLRIGSAHHTGAIAERNHAIDNFILAFPGVALRILRRSPAQLYEDLEHNRIDLAITLEFDDPAHAAPANPRFQRWTIASRALKLAVPVDHPLAAEAELSPHALKGMAIGTIDRSHGVAVAEGVARLLVQTGAQPLTLPEGDAQAVLRQCAQLGRCAIDLGWFGSTPSSMRSIAVTGWEARTSLVALANPGHRREGAESFLDGLPTPATSLL
jgi:DNA-binding transcriptional LysR family regulator